MEGTIGRILRGKNFGFIHDPAGEQIFFHGSQLRSGSLDLLREGDAVSFTIGSDSRNPEKKMATDVHAKVDLSTRTPFVHQPRQPAGGYQGYGGYGGGYQQGGRGRGRGFGRGGGYGRHQQAPAYGAQYHPYAPYQQPEMLSGTIARLNQGYGFLHFQGQDYFFPGKSVLNNQFGELQQGDAVIFSLGPDQRDPSNIIAMQIKKANGQGTVEKLANGYGFIKSSEGEQIFFHARNLQGAAFEDLTEGTQLSFVVSPSQNKPGSFEAKQITIQQSEPLGHHL